MVRRCKRPRIRYKLGGMSRGAPRGNGCFLVRVVICIGLPLHAMLVWLKPMTPSLIYVVELFIHPFSSLIHSFSSR